MSGILILAVVTASIVPALKTMSSTGPPVNASAKIKDALKIKSGIHLPVHASAAVSTVPATRFGTLPLVLASALRLSALPPRALIQTPASASAPLVSSATAGSDGTPTHANVTVWAVKPPATRSRDGIQTHAFVTAWLYQGALTAIDSTQLLVGALLLLWPLQ